MAAVKSSSKRNTRITNVCDRHFAFFSFFKTFLYTMKIVIINKIFNPWFDITPWVYEDWKHIHDMCIDTHTHIQIYITSIFKRNGPILLCTRSSNRNFWEISINTKRCIYQSVQWKWLIGEAESLFNNNCFCQILHCQQTNSLLH